MKLLILTHDYPPKSGGISRYSAELVRGLMEAGNDITVLAPGTPSEMDSIALRIKMPRLSPLTVLSWMRALKQYPHANVICTNWYPCGLAAWLSRRRYHLCAHGAELLPKKGFLQPLKHFFRRRVIKAALGVFPGSRYAASLVSELGRDARATAVLSYGVDTEQFHPGADQSTRVPIVLTVCRLDPHKGVDTALEALALCVRAGTPFHYRVAGTGKDAQRLAKLAKDLGVESFVSFLGAVSDAELTTLYQRCDLFLLTSRPLLDRSFVEGFGMVFLEAAACGKAAVGSECGGIPEAVIHGETGLLVPPGNAEATAQAIMLLLQDANLRNRLATEALRRAREEMSWSKVARRLTDRMEEFRG